MNLKIHTTQNALAYEGGIAQISLPTEQGQKTIAQSSVPMVITLLPGLISITTEQGEVKTLSISKGIALVDEKNIRITTSTLTATPLQKLAELRSNQYLLELKLQKLRNQGNIEDINSLILELEKVKADILLAQKS